jgi:hypothetical protein
MKGEGAGKVCRESAELYPQFPRFANSIFWPLMAEIQPAFPHFDVLRRFAARMVLLTKSPIFDRRTLELRCGPAAKGRADERLGGVTLNGGND